MVDPIAYAIQTIYFNIPQEILDLVFKQNQNTLFQTDIGYSIDKKIVDEVIMKRVFNDCNIYGGQLKRIVLLQEWCEFPAPTEYEQGIGTGKFSIYRIPPINRENVPIVRVQSISYPSTMTGTPLTYAGSSAGTTVNMLAHEVLESQTYSLTPAMPIPQATGFNDIVRLFPPQHTHVNWVLTCRLAYDPSMLNLPPSTLKGFSEMCLYACQAYIYNTLIVKIDKAYIEAGSEIESIKNIIDKYEDAEEKYQEALMRFRGGTALDTQTKMMYLKYML